MEGAQRPHPGLDSPQGRQAHPEPAIFTRKLGTTVYFADPYCSGQKGAVENANKLLRQYFPKGTDFRLVPQSELDKVQHKINGRPRKNSGFSTPLEEFLKHLR